MGRQQKGPGVAREGEKTVGKIQMTLEVPLISEDTTKASWRRWYLKQTKLYPWEECEAAEGVTEQLGTKHSSGKGSGGARGQDGILTEGWRGEHRDFGRNGCVNKHARP